MRAGIDFQVAAVKKKVVSFCGKSFFKYVKEKRGGGPGSEVLQRPQSSPTFPVFWVAFPRHSYQKLC